MRGLSAQHSQKRILPKTLSDFSKENEYGITLISLNEEYREQEEPGAAPYAERLAALRALRCRLQDMGKMNHIRLEPNRSGLG